MPDDPPMWLPMYPPIEVTWNAERSELSILGTVGIGIDGKMRQGFELTPVASRQVLLCIRRLLENLDVDAIDTRPRDLQ